MATLCIVHGITTLRNNVTVLVILQNRILVSIAVNTPKNLFVFRSRTLNSDQLVDRRAVISINNTLY